MPCTPLVPCYAYCCSHTFSNWQCKTRFTVRIPCEIRTSTLLKVQNYIVFYMFYHVVSHAWFTWGIEVCIVFYNTKCTSVSCPTTLIFHHSHLFLSSPDFSQWHQVCHRRNISYVSSVRPCENLVFWTRVTLGLDMCKVCTEAVHCVALWTRVTLGLDMCKVCTEAVHCVALWTRVTLGLDMCKVCTEAVHCVALWTRVTSGLDMCQVCKKSKQGKKCIPHHGGLWTVLQLPAHLQSSAHHRTKEPPEPAWAPTVLRIIMRFNAVGTLSSVGWAWACSVSKTPKVNPVMPFSRYWFRNRS